MSLTTICSLTTTIDIARYLGRNACSIDCFVDAMSSHASRRCDTIKDLLALWMHVKSCTDPEDMFAYIEQNVWHNEVATVFFMEYPLDWILVYMYHRPATEHYVRFLSMVMARGANAERIAASVVEPFAKTLLTDESRVLVARIVQLLLDLMKQPEFNILLVCDCKLFHALSGHVSSRKHVLLPILEFCGAVLPRLPFVCDLKDFVRRFSTILMSSASCMDSNDRTLLCDFLSRLYDYPEMQTFVSKLGCDLFSAKKHRSIVECETFFRALLSTPCVYFVVLLGRRNLLDDFRAAIHEWSSSSLRLLLNQHCPHPSTSKREDSKEMSQPSSFFPECPITLCPCISPVVASDGYTYERSAIIHHMIVSKTERALSPLTKQPLAYDLFPNRAIMP